MRSCERLNPIARRSSSAWPPVKPAAVIAISDQLLLKQRHAQRARQDRLQRRVRVAHRLAAVAPREVRVDHLAHDRAGADDRHLDHQVVEARRLHARQRRHLRARFDLEHPDGVGGAQHARRPSDRRAAAGRSRSSRLRGAGPAAPPPRAPPSSRGRAGRPSRCRGRRSRPCPTARPPGRACSPAPAARRSSRRPAAITMPPECWPRWRGRFSSACATSPIRRLRCSVGGKPAAARWVSIGSSPGHQPASAGDARCD